MLIFIALLHSDRHREQVNRGPSAADSERHQSSDSDGAPRVQQRPPERVPWIPNHLRLQGPGYRTAR